MTKYKRGMISPFNLFAILFVCRLLVAFTASTGFIVGGYTPDIVISAIIGLVLVLILSIPCFFAVNNRNMFENKWISTLYAFYFIYIGSISVCKFSYFASTELDPSAKIIFFSAMIILACTYTATLGIESISRFASFVFIVVLLGAVSICVLSSSSFSIINLFPFTKNPASTVLINSLIITADTNELILFLALSPKVNGKTKKPFYFGIILSILTIIIMILVTIGSLGDAATLSAYPIFAMAQISTFEFFERLDSVYMSFWIFAAFLKTSVYIYAASSLIKCGKHKNKCKFTGALMFTLSFIMINFNLFAKIEKAALIIPFFIFALLIPLTQIIFKKKSKGEKLLESF